MSNEHSPAESKSITRRRRTRRHSVTAIALSVAVAGASLLVMGGEASAASKSAAKSSAKGVSKKSLSKFESCLAKQGVKINFKGAGTPPKGGVGSGTIPTGAGAPSGVKVSAKTQKAFKTCSAFLPAGSPFGTAPTSSSSVTTADAAFRNCMTLNHVTLAKGVYGTTSSSTNVTSTSSSTYKKAYAACSVLLPKSATKSVSG